MNDPRESIVEHCTSPGCARDARAAVRTTRSARDDIRVTLHPDNRTAPKAAGRYCYEHTLALLADLTKVLVSPDE